MSRREVSKKVQSVDPLIDQSVTVCLQRAQVPLHVQVSLSSTRFPFLMCSIQITVHKNIIPGVSFHVQRLMSVSATVAVHMCKSSIHSFL